MKIVILAGGLGTRLSEYTKSIPKPMVKINKLPMLIHIMKIYIKFGHRHFYIAAGYKKEVIESYFKNFSKNGKIFKEKLFNQDCYINILNTGKSSMTGGRLKRISKYIEKDEDFMFTYGDGLSNINLSKLNKFHKKNKKIVTVTAVRPPARFGELTIKKNIVSKFTEKPQVSEGWINGGFFIANKKIFDFIKNDKTILEKEPLEILAKKKQLLAFKHKGFWRCMDTKRDKDFLEKLSKSKKGRW